VVIPCNYLSSIKIVIRQYDITKIIPCFFLKISCHKHNLKPFLTDYIYLISYKFAKKASPRKKDLPLLKNDITTFELALKYGIHSSNMQSGLVTCSLEISEILTIEVTRRNWVASNNDLPQLHSKIGNGK